MWPGRARGTDESMSGMALRPELMGMAAEQARRSSQATPSQGAAHSLGPLAEARRQLHQPLCKTQTPGFNIHVGRLTSPVSWELAENPALRMCVETECHDITQSSILPKRVRALQPDTS